MLNPRFIHLKVHSDYSVIDGLNRIDELIQRSVYLNMPALAITDFTNLFGTIKFYQHSYRMGIKPIIGADFLLKKNKGDCVFFEITILAANNLGYKNLILLITEAYKKKKEDNLFIFYDWLANYNKGLILLSGARKGDLGKHLINNNLDEIKSCLLFYKRYFNNRYYIELVRTGRIREEEYLYKAINLARENDLPVVATNDVRFIYPCDFKVHNIKVSINHGEYIFNKNNFCDYSEQQYMRDEQEMCDLFYDIPEALSNSVEIAKRCNVTIFCDKYFLPQFITKKISNNDYLIKIANSGLKKRMKIDFSDKKVFLKNNKTYIDRLNYELSIIINMGFSGYFLIVAEFILWAKNNDIPVGPGRGSGAGSLVAYSLKITDIDPIKFNLLFERFLNPERVSMPDFDIDLCVKNRDLVFNHLVDIYGKNSVFHIITFGTMAARMALRDVGRVLGYSYGFIDYVSKLIPKDYGITLNEALQIDCKLKYIYEYDKDIKILINIASKLEGVVRNISTHAGGIIISPTNITDFSPLFYDAKSSRYITQFDKDDIKNIGLVKFDLLGLRTLTIIHSSVKLINLYRRKKGLSILDINSISLNDKNSFVFLKQARTTAVFQLESYGMKNLIIRLQPNCFEDIVSLLALFRPGPLQSGMVDNFINRKLGYERVCYPDIKYQHKLLKPILEFTYGIILYQEQVMKIAQVLAGYTLGQADILCRAMSKKNKKEMEKQREIFLHKSKIRGIDCSLSMKIFNLMEKFAGYGFNRSHSVAYAFLAYQTLWLKSNYTSEFMVSVMNADINDIDKITKLIYECWSMGLKILTPDINHSEYYFYINKKRNIVYGLGAIKGIGKEIIKNIISIRNKSSFFKDIFDFCEKINIKLINKKVWESLVFSGSLDCFKLSREFLVSSLKKIRSISQQYIQKKIFGQMDMFELDEKVIYCQKINSIFSKKEILIKEKEVLGFYISDNPINNHIYEIKHYTNGVLLSNIHKYYIGKSVTISGVILSLKKLFSKRGNYIGVVTLVDSFCMLDVVLFSHTFTKYFNLLKINDIVIVYGYIISNLNYFIKLKANRILKIDDIRNKQIFKVEIMLLNTQVNIIFLKKLYSLLNTCKQGKIPIYFFYKKKSFVFFNQQITISFENNILDDLYDLVGKSQVLLYFNK